MIKKVIFNFMYFRLYVLSIVLSHLSKNCVGISNNGYFHWKTHIGSFILSNWELLFDSSW